MRKRITFTLLSFLVVCGGLLALPTKTIAANNDMKVTIQADIPVSLDVTDRTNPVFRGSGNIYMTTEDATSRQFISVDIPTELTMNTPEGEVTAEEGLSVTYNGSMNARKGYVNYEAINGINGKTIEDISMGSIEVVVPITKELLSHGVGNYSISIPITFTAGAAYGSYSANLDFTPWDELISSGKVTVSNNKVTKITMQDEILEIDPSITALSSNIFKNTTYKEVYVPETITSASNAFNQSNVETIILADGMTTVPASIATGATSLRKVVLPTTAKNFGNYAFDGCENLTDINMPSVMSLGLGCFKNCKGIKEFTFNEGTTVTTVSRDTYSPFYGAGLTNVTISEGVTTLPNYMFCDCEDLSSVYLPTTLSKIGSNCFKGVPSLTEITIQSELTRTTSSTVVGAFTDTGLTKITFADGITSVPRYLFSDGCANVTELNLPDSITTIEANAFAGCSSLTNINLPANISVIGGEAFKDATSVKELHISNNITMPRSTVSSPFKGSGIETLVFEEGVTTIVSRLFSNGCTHMTSLSLPSTIQKIESNAFENCTSLTTLTIPADITVGYGSVVSPFNGGGITEINFADGVTTVGALYLANSGNSEMLIHLPTSIANIDSKSFAEGQAYSVLYDGTEAEYSLITKGEGFTPQTVVCSDTLLNASFISTDSVEPQELEITSLDELSVIEDEPVETNNNSIIDEEIDSTEEINDPSETSDESVTTDEDDGLGDEGTVSLDAVDDASVSTEPEVEDRTDVAITNVEENDNG